MPSMAGVGSQQGSRVLCSCYLSPLEGAQSSQSMSHAGQIERAKGGGALTEDWASRLPTDPSVMPMEVSHIWDDRCENFRVTYLHEHPCKDGRSWKTFWYRCRSKGVEEGSAQHDEGHRGAEEAAWGHIQTALGAAAAGSSERVNLEFGKGKLHGG